MGFSLLPLEKSYKVNANDSLDAAFSQTESSHDTVLVYDGNEFIGTTSPSYALFRNRYTPDTKVGSATVRPPRITSDTPLSRIAEFMLSTSMYQLPVFNESSDIIGLITADSLLNTLLSDDSLFSQVSGNIKTEVPITAPINSNVRDLYFMLREKGVSRIVLVRDSGGVEAVITRRDIQSFLVKPTGRERIRSAGTNDTVRTFEFGSEKEKRMEASADSFANRNVISLPEKTDMKSILNELRDKQTGSVLLISSNDDPTGIISKRTVLKALSKQESVQEVPVVIKNNADLAASDISHIEEAVTKYANKLKKRSSLERIELLVEEAKNTAGRPTSFELQAEAFFYSGQRLHARAEGRELIPTVREILDRFERQEDGKDLK